ncbi:helix-turn-helix transcriptional regulator [Psychrobacter sp. UBA3480]|uniref:helix-turn-helix domain-containing protein n=1 Tax=Psychrobacter sp. UBA3480 TaxID=1947350 RepID=UPI0025E01A3B|nr:helix-turn-helix transcriptional regulator [Psychrobacter sp. UBA3480]
MSKQVKIEIPPEISFLDLGLHKDDDSAITYKLSVLNSMLAYNNIKLSQLTQDDVESLLVMWYISHRKNGGDPDMTAERLFNAVADTPKFDVKIHWDAIIEPPTPEQIKDLRQHTGMTQPQVANLLGLSNRQLISDYERGNKSPNLQTWTLWLLLTGQHPTLTLSDKRS